MRIGGARCEGLSLLFSFLSLARFPFFKGRFCKISLFFKALIRPNKGKRSSIEGSMFQAWKMV
jgi:hypothetical protein